MTFHSGDVDPVHCHLILERREFNDASSDEWVPMTTFWGIARTNIQSFIDLAADRVKSYRGQGWDLRWRVLDARVGRQTVWSIALAGDDAPGVFEA